VNTLILEDKLRSFETKYDEVVTFF
jgi:hypothetical protein